MVHDLTALRPAMITMILSIAAHRFLRLLVHDLNQAYLQSHELSTRDV